MSLSLLWYVVDTRKWFKGPRVNLEHEVFTGGRVTGGRVIDALAVEEE
jgi:hypothetical protein